MTRKIAAHYYFDEFGKFVKFPIISFSDGIITSIVGNDSLPEVSGLEFYSGILLPRFIDVISSNALRSGVIHPSFTSPLVSKIVVLHGEPCDIPLNFSDPLRERIVFLNSPVLDIICNSEFDGLLIFPKIRRMMELEEIKSMREGIYFFTYGVAELLQFPNFSRIIVGSKAEFILCSDMNLIKMDTIDERFFRRLV